MGWTMAVAEWSDDDGGLVLDLDATELIATLHEEDASTGTVNEVVVIWSTPQDDVLPHAV
jgi:hypothetical protein